MARWPGMVPRYTRPLKEGDVILDAMGAHHFIEYVNSSGAYAIPLTGTVRSFVRTDKEGNKKEHHHTEFDDGKAISANSCVEIIDPLTLGVSSPEYARYVRISGGRGTGMARKAATFTEFDSSPLPESGIPIGQLVGAESETPNQEGSEGMAKKGKSKANGAAKRERAPETVRKCACGCGGETTGHFVPGHDARFHGWLKKLADGRIDGSGKDTKSGEKIIPGAVIKALDLKATKEGHKAQSPHFYQEA